MATQLRCELHGIPQVSFCPACRGAVRSPRKVRSSRRNGKLGGRPRERGEAKKGGKT